MAIGRASPWSSYQDRGLLSAGYSCPEGCSYLPERSHVQVPPPVDRDDHRRTPSPLQLHGDRWKQRWTCAATPSHETRACCCCLWRGLVRVVWLSAGCKGSGMV